MTMQVGREQIIAFRVAAHHLDRRLPAGSLLEALAACGIRTRPGDTALLALGARVDGVAQEDLDRALEDKSVVEVLSARATAVIVPAPEISVFTLGALPNDEQSLRDALRAFVPILDREGMSATQALRLASDVASEALAERPLSKGELSGVLTRRMPRLSPMCRGRCNVEHIDDMLFRLVGVGGVWCYLPGAGGMSVRIDRWLGAMPTGHRDARAELVRRYLGCHGPSTAGELAAWAGISPADANRALLDLEPELIEVRAGDRKRAWALARDAGALASPPDPGEARLLPANDPYLTCRDRDNLVPDPAAKKRVWRAQASPGAALVGAELVATWRTHKKGKRLQFVFEPIGKFPKRTLARLQGEAERIAEHRGCTSAELVPAG